MCALKLKLKSLHKRNASWFLFNWLSLLIVNLIIIHVQCSNSENELKYSHRHASDFYNPEREPVPHSDVQIAPNNGEKTAETPKNSGCVMMDGLCIAYADVSSYEAIKALHAHLDDDHSGDIDLSESVDFLREELNYTKGLEKRQKAFHYNNDQHISVHELWEIWLSNEVHNWTVEQTVGWLYVCVELGQYADVFYENAVNGSLLPRLAVNNDNFLTRILGIKSPTHKSKISIKAMDIVLFGPPKETGSLVKDISIVSLILVILILIYMSRSNNKALKKMDHEMESLQKELFEFQMAKTTLVEGSSNGFSRQSEEGQEVAETEYQDKDSTAAESSWKLDSELHHDFSDLDPGWRKELLLWLQLTYEKEKANLAAKLKNIQQQIFEAQDMCDKLKPNRKNLFGALSFIHGKMDSKGHSILLAKSAFDEIQETTKEMEHRWLTMEKLLGATITQNMGHDFLQHLLEEGLFASMTHTASSDVVQQLLLSQSALIFLTTGAYPGLSNSTLERGAVTPTNIFKSHPIPEDTVRKRRRFSQVRGASIMSEESVDSSIISLRSLGSTRSQRSTVIPHSQTIGAGLSSHGNEELRPRSCSSESKMRKLSNGSHLEVSSTRSVVNGYSTDENDSSGFMVGESAIKIDSSSVAPQGQFSPQSSPSASLRGSYTEAGSQRSLSEKQSTMGKFSSEPTLEIQEPVTPPSSETEPSIKSASKKGITKSWLIKKLKPKPDKK